MKIALLVIAFSTFASLLFAQNTRVHLTIASEEIPAGIGRGIVYSLPDSSLIQGNYMDSMELSIKFKAKKNDQFYLKLNLPGFRDTLINFTVQDTLVELGVIDLNNFQTFDEVNVVYREPFFERTINGLKVNVKGTTLEELNTLFDILKASPKLNSPDDESIEIIGRGSPLILIDRQPLMSNDELKAIPANQVDRFEILTNPSAKYKAQGSGNGVIEVFTTNFSLEGYNANIRLQGGVNTQLRPNGSSNAGISFKRKKFSLSGYGGVYYNSSNSFGESSGNSTVSDLNNTSTYDGDRYNVWRNFKVKMGYALTDSSRLSFGVYGHGSTGANNFSTESAYYSGDTLRTYRNEQSSNDYKWLNNSAYVNYTKDLDSLGSYFEVNANFTKRISDQNGISENTFRYGLGTLQNNVKTESFDRPNVGELSVNFEHHFDTSEFKLELGATYNILQNEKRFRRYTSENGSWIEDNSARNSYNYMEHIVGGFAQISKMLTKKLGAQLGVRAEYTLLDGYSKTLDKQFMDSSYLLPFPNAGMLYKFSDNVSLTAYYETGIDRPQFNNYDPFVRVIDSLTIQVGNPFLRPSYSHTFGAELELFYSYSLSFSYARYTNDHGTISFLDTATLISTSTPWNSNYNETYSLSMSIPVRAKWVNGWNSIWIDYNNYYFTDVFNRDPFTNLNFGFYSYLTFNLPKDFQIMNQFSVHKWANDEMDGNVTQRWGIRLTKKFKKPDINIFAEVQNIIPTINRNDRITGNYLISSVSRNQFTTFQAGIFFKFGRLKSDPSIKESKSGQNDRL